MDAASQQEADPDERLRFGERRRLHGCMQSRASASRGEEGFFVRLEKNVSGKERTSCASEQLRERGHARDRRLAGGPGGRGARQPGSVGGAGDAGERIGDSKAPRKELGGRWKAR